MYLWRVYDNRILGRDNGCSLKALADFGFGFVRPGPDIPRKPQFVLILNIPRVSRSPPDLETRFFCRGIGW